MGKVRGREADTDKDAPPAMSVKPSVAFFAVHQSPLIDYPGGGMSTHARALRVGQRAARQSRVLLVMGGIK